MSRSRSRRRTPAKPRRHAAPRRRVMAAGALLRDNYAVHHVFEALAALPDPDSLMAAAGIERHQLRQMDEQDDFIHGALDTRRGAVLAMPWRLERLEGGDGKPEDANTLFVWEQLEQNIGSESLVHALLRAAWDAVPYGYSVAQVKYRRLDGGRVGIEWARTVPMQDFRPDRAGQLLMRDAATGDFRPLRDKERRQFFLTRRFPTYAQPYGEALLSRLYWPWFFRHNGWRFWMQFLERFGDPLLLAKSDRPRHMADELLRLGFESFISVAIDDEVTAIHATGKDSFEQLELALQRRVNLLILGQTLTADVGQRGSYAAAKVHNEVRLDKRDADLRLVIPTVQRVVDALWAENGFSGTPPTFIMDDGRGLQKDRAERDALLVQAGVLRLTRDYLLRVYDFEDGDFEVPEQGAAPANQGMAAGGRLALGTGAPYTPGQQRLEALADSALDLAGAPIDPDALREAIRTARSPEALDAALARLAADADPAAYRDLLERALFAADVLGYMTADRQEA